MACQYFSPCEHGAESFTVMMPKLTFGRGCLAEVGARAMSRGLTDIALFVDPNLTESAYVTTVCKSLKTVNINYAIFSDIRIEPDEKTVNDATKFLDSHPFDGVISLGGGSTIDTAKAALLYSKYPASFTDYFAPPVGAGKPIEGPVLPHIACPTTSGTGSECTSVTVLRVTSLNTKFVIGSPHLVPTDAIVDPACTDTLPSNVIASTGFDLLCHALECYTAKAYTQHDKVVDPNKRSLLQGANPWSDLSARRALEIVGTFLSRGVNDKDDTEARDNLMWGATLAGMAFGNSGTHLPHAMSYGVTHLMHDITTDGYSAPSPFVPHGISVVVSAPAIFKYQAEAAPQRHIEAAGYLGVNTNDVQEQEAGEVVANRLIELMKATHVPNGLSGVGFNQDHIKDLANSSIRQSRSIANAPRETNLVDIENIYGDALEYW